jgi:hypothetical protein
MSGPRFYYAMFGFTTDAFFVVYGDPSIPSHSVWLIPGSWED